MQMRINGHQMALITSGCDAMRTNEHQVALITSDRGPVRRCSSSGRSRPHTPTPARSSSPRRSAQPSAILLAPPCAFTRFFNRDKHGEVSKMTVSSMASKGASSEGGQAPTAGRRVRWTDTPTAMCTASALPPSPTSCGCPSRPSPAGFEHSACSLIRHAECSNTAGVGRE